MIQIQSMNCRSANSSQSDQLSVLPFEMYLPDIIPWMKKQNLSATERIKNMGAVRLVQIAARAGECEVSQV